MSNAHAIVEQLRSEVRIIGHKCLELPTPAREPGGLLAPYGNLLHLTARNVLHEVGGRQFLRQFSASGSSETLYGARAVTRAG